ncbi:MAG: trypsin-like peptidase domain-containing protein [Deltaproteobacteria bacterium]|nr:trypsin-like peptidase domain-containing protein [Deltaproteobacteria bacterium]
MTLGTATFKVNVATAVSEPDADHLFTVTWSDQPEQLLWDGDLDLVAKDEIDAMTFSPEVVPIRVDPFTAEIDHVPVSAWESELLEASSIRTIRVFVIGSRAVALTTRRPRSENRDATDRYFGSFRLVDRHRWISRMPRFAPQQARPRSRDWEIAPSVLEKVKAATVFLRNEFGEGTGFIVGYEPAGRAIIATNAHVVMSADGTWPETRAFFFPGDVLEQSGVTGRVSWNADLDIAVLRAPRPNPAPTPLTLSAEPVPRPTIAFTAGFPLGTDLAVTGDLARASVSLARVPIRDLAADLPGLLRFRGIVHPGNSGGPLVDTRGTVHGIVTLKNMATDEGYAALASDLLSALRSGFPRQPFGCVHCAAKRQPMSSSVTIHGLDKIRRATALVRVADKIAGAIVFDVDEVGALVATTSALVGDAGRGNIQVFTDKDHQARAVREGSLVRTVGPIAILRIAGWQPPVPPWRKSDVFETEPVSYLAHAGPPQPLTPEMSSVEVGLVISPMRVGDPQLSAISSVRRSKRGVVEVIQFDQAERSSFGVWVDENGQIAAVQAGLLGEGRFVVGQPGDRITEAIDGEILDAVAVARALDGDECEVHVAAHVRNPISHLAAIELRAMRQNRRWPRQRQPLDPIGPVVARAASASKLIASPDDLVRLAARISPCTEGGAIRLQLSSHGRSGHVQETPDFPVLVGGKKDDQPPVSLWFNAVQSKPERPLSNPLATAVWEPSVAPMQTHALPVSGNADPLAKVSWTSAELETLTPEERRQATSSVVLGPWSATGFQGSIVERVLAAVADSTKRCLVTDVVGKTRDGVEGRVAVEYVSANGRINAKEPRIVADDTGGSAKWCLSGAFPDTLDVWGVPTPDGAVQLEWNVSIPPAEHARR